MNYYKTTQKIEHGDAVEYIGRDKFIGTHISIGPRSRGTINFNYTSKSPTCVGVSFCPHNHHETLYLPVETIVLIAKRADLIAAGDEVKYNGFNPNVPKCNGIVEKVTSDLQSVIVKFDSRTHFTLDYNSVSRVKTFAQKNAEELAAQANEYMPWRIFDDRQQWYGKFADEQEACEFAEKFSAVDRKLFVAKLHYVFESKEVKPIVVRTKLA